MNNEINVFIDNDNIGYVRVIGVDDSMGVIVGELFPNGVYEKYKSAIKKISNEKGIANVDDFNFQISIDGTFISDPIGGIGISHIQEFEDEIHFEAGGVDRNTINFCTTLLKEKQ